MTKKPTSERNSPVDRGAIVAGYLDRLNRGEVVDPLEVLTDHPEQAQEILEELEVFVELEQIPGDDTPLGTLGDYFFIEAGVDIQNGTGRGVRGVGRLDGPSGSAEGAAGRDSG